MYHNHLIWDSQENGTDWERRKKAITEDFCDDRVRTITLIWDKTNPEAIEIAQKNFTEYLEKGWIAFSVTSDKKQVQVYTFSPKFEKIILTRLVEGG